VMRARDSDLHVVRIVRSRFCWHRSDEYFALLLFFYLRFGLRSLERGGEGERDSDGDGDGPSDSGYLRLLVEGR
jgi:hypothetical protein